MNDDFQPWPDKNQKIDLDSAWAVRVRLSEAFQAVLNLSTSKHIHRDIHNIFLNLFLGGEFTYYI